MIRHLPFRHKFTQFFLFSHPRRAHFQQFSLDRVFETKKKWCKFAGKRHMSDHVWLNQTCADLLRLPLISTRFWSILLIMIAFHHFSLIFIAFGAFWLFSLYFNHVHAFSVCFTIFSFVFMCFMCFQWCSSIFYV